MKIWISKYALTGGVTEHECHAYAKDVDFGNNVYVYPGKPNSFTGFLLGRDAHTTQAAAFSAAEAQRKKKLASLHKQIAKLEKMVFDSEAST